jgi:streptogramin lyase
MALTTSETISLSKGKSVLRRYRGLLLLMAGVMLALAVASPAFAHAASVTASDYSVSSGSDPWGTAFDKSGNVWLAMPGCDPTPMCSAGTPPGKIEEFNPSTSSWGQTLQLPAGYGQPLFLAFDSKGRLWFPSPMSNSIAMYNPGTKTFHQWTVPTANSLPWDVVVDLSGNIWFTEHNTNKIARFNPNTHVFKEFATPAANSWPYGITVDAKNNIWFTENNATVALIAKYNASTGKLLEYKIRTTQSNLLTPHLIVVDHNGNIWWSEGFAGAIAELNVAQAVLGTNKGVTEHFYTPTCSTCGEHTSGISVDSNGNIWFDDSNQSIYGSFPASGSGTFTTYNTPTSSSHPHDGLNVDSQNHIWFDEEFANKLAKVTQ